VTTAFNHITQQLADNTSFLWELRARQRREPHVYSEHIQETDDRIQANLDGLFLNVDEAWAAATANGEFPQGGEAFCLGVLAFSSEDAQKIQYATEFGLQNSETFKGLASCLAWLPGAKAHPWITQLFQSKNLDHKRLSLAACRIRREDPAGFLTQIFERKDCLSHPDLLAEALRSVGVFKRADLAALPSAFLIHADPLIVFWAIYASLRLANFAPAEALKPFCTTDDENLKPLKQKALLLAMHHLPRDTARSWIGEWVEQDSPRVAIQACGMLGDATSIPWLISQMALADLNRIAGEAFYLITGQLAPAGVAFDIAPEGEDETLNDDGLPWVDAAQTAAMLHHSAALNHGNEGTKPSAMRYTVQQVFLS
jgi:uncharacterized protein (TIGR02270 family)